MKLLPKLLHKAVRFSDFPLHAQALANASFKGRLLLLYGFAQNLYLALTTYKAELTLLNAAAGHAAAGVYDVPLKCGYAEGGTGPLVYGYARIQILYYYGSAKKVLEYAPVALLKAHKI